MPEPGSVDVVVPCYQYGHFLRECVQSVLAEANRRVRVLIIDDASPDNTAEIASALAQQDGRVTWRQHSSNCGHIATYNEGIKWANADYMLILSADDLVTPGALARAGALLDANPDVVMTYGPVLLEPPHASLPEPATTEWEIFGSDIFLRRRMRASCTDRIEACTTVVRTAVQKRIGFYRHDLPHAGDYEMWLRFAARGKVGRLRAVQGIYRQHGNNMWLEYFDNPCRDIIQRTMAVEHFITSDCGRISNADSLRKHLHAQNARRAVNHAAGAFAAGDRVIFDELMALATQLDPRVRFTPLWNKQKIKLLLGHTVCATLKRHMQAPRRHLPDTMNKQPS